MACQSSLLPWMPRVLLGPLDTVGCTFALPAIPSALEALSFNKKGGLLLELNPSVQEAKAGSCHKLRLDSKNLIQQNNKLDFL